jgi:hypothetical protein
MVWPDANLQEQRIRTRNTYLVAEIESRLVFVPQRPTVRFRRIRIRIIILRFYTYADIGGGILGGRNEILTTAIVEYSD